MISQALCDWLDKAGNASTAFDFPTKGILQYAVAHCEYWRLAKDGKPSGERRACKATNHLQAGHGL